jgi:uncharacterized coiled-coil DUF342 family protein
MLVDDFDKAVGDYQEDRDRLDRLETERRVMVKRRDDVLTKLADLDQQIDAQREKRDEARARVRAVLEGTPAEPDPPADPGPPS